MINNAFIFDIQRASFVDGPGMRTVIFFKGCNLNCQWCHNPEGIKKQRQLLFYQDKCTNCGKCKQVCQNNFEYCNACGKCAEVCPNEARILCGKSYTATELIDIVKKDHLFYSATNGGVTLSGGECLLQSDFVLTLLKLLKAENIHTAVDTAGNLDFSVFEKIIGYTDLFLYDIKLFTKNLHKKFTGVDNLLILENLKKLINLGANVNIRIPIIPTVNDNEDEMRKIKEFLDSVQFKGKVDLLGYHSMGENKNKALKNKFVKFSSIDNKKLEILTNIFK